MQKIITKITSRKFLLSVGAFVAALAAGNVTAATVISALYVAAEAYVDGQSKA